jgi:hypothetical protein
MDFSMIECMTNALQNGASGLWDDSEGSETSDMGIYKGLATFKSSGCLEVRQDLSRLNTLIYLPETNMVQSA